MAELVRAVPANAPRLCSPSRAMKTRADERAQFEVQDSGNTFRQVQGATKLAVSSLRYYAGVPYELKRQTIPASPACFT